MTFDNRNGTARPAAAYQPYLKPSFSNCQPHPHHTPCDTHHVFRHSERTTVSFNPLHNSHTTPILRHNPTNPPRPPNSVPRAALYNPPPTSTSPSPELADQLHAHLARIYSQTPTTATTTTTTPTAAPPADPPPSEPPTYEFRLFSHQTTHPTQKITIRSPTPPPEGAVGGFLVPSRPRGYFFSDDDGTTTAGRKRREYEEASISGSEILRLSHLPSVRRCRPSILRPPFPSPQSETEQQNSRPENNH